MKYKKLTIYFLSFLFAFSLFSSINFSVAGDLSSLKIVLINDAKDYETYGFKDLGVYYTPQALCEFHMPFIVPKKDSGVLTKNDLTGNFLNTPSNLTSRKPTLKYTVLAENDNYYIIDYQMNIEASTSKFSVDFVPSVKGKSFSEFAWWNSNWDFREQITIKPDYIDATLTNFPVLINISANTTFYDKVKTDLSDIRFTLDDNSTRLNHEINDYNIGASDVSFNIWMNVTSISSSVDTVIYIYFGNSDASALSAADINATWDINYSGVYHLEETASSTCKDSTVNQNSGTYIGDLPNASSCCIGSGQSMDGTGDYIDMPHASLEISQTGTIECYVDLDVSSTQQDIFALRKDNENVIYFEVTVGNKWYTNAYWTDGIKWDNATTNSDTNTHYFGQAWQTNDMILRNNGAELYVDKACSLSAWGTLDHFNIGTNVVASGSFVDGLFDEVRISNIRRSDAWMDASYDTYYQSDFITFGTLEGTATMIVTNPDPLNTSTGVSPYAQNVSISVTEPEGGTMDVYFLSNSSGSWVEFGSNISVVNGTYHQNNSNLSGFNTKYWWSVNCTNGTVWYNYTYGFTTRSSYAPGNPTNENGVLIDVDSLNISWTKGTYADNTLVVMKANGYPSSRTDGTVLYNGTLSTYTDNVFNTTNKYTLYSWNSTDDLYSSGVNVVWGSLTINVFDESNGTAINNWNIFISNQDGTNVYENTSNNNPLIIDVDDIPHGEDVTIRINANGYRNQTYIKTLYANAQYVLNAHLAPESYSELYLLQVKNEIDLVVPDAYITIRRYINETVGFGNISRLITDGEGQINIYLMPNNLYKITIEATGYDTGYSDYYPSDSIFTHTLRIYFSNGTGVPKEYLFDNIGWSITPTDPYHNNSIDVAYTINSDDGKLEWFNATVHIWNSTNEIWVLLYAENITDQPTGGTINYTIANNTGKYSFTCRFKKEGFPVYTFGTDESCRIYYIYLPDRGWGIENIPSFIYMLFTIILMIGATGLLALVGAGDASGIGGMGVMAIMFAYNPSLLIGGISCWFVLFAAVIVYGAFLFVMKE